MLLAGVWLLHTRVHITRVWTRNLGERIFSGLLSSPHPSSHSAGVGASTTPGGSGSSTVSAPTASYTVASGGRGINATIISAPPYTLGAIRRRWTAYPVPMSALTASARRSANGAVNNAARVLGGDTGAAASARTGSSDLRVLLLSPRHAAGGSRRIPPCAAVCPGENGACHAAGACCGA